MSEWLKWPENKPSEKCDLYWVTIKFRGKFEVEVLEYDMRKHWTDFNLDIWDDFVVAWKPMSVPEPYMEVE